MKTMVVLTSFALVYIHMQMQIFDLAYKGKYKEKELRKLIDDNGNVTYNILKLKSSNHLGEKLLGEESHLQFLDNARVVELNLPPVKEERGILALSSDADKKSNFFTELFTLKSQAVAKPIE